MFYTILPNQCNTYMYTSASFTINMTFKWKSLQYNGEVGVNEQICFLTIDWETVIYTMCVSEMPNACNSQPCQHGGGCVGSSAGYKCTCKNGDVGVNCGESRGIYNVF